MRIQSVRKSIFAGVMIATTSPVFAGETKIEQVPATEVASKQYSFHVHDATSQQVLDQFSKASGITIDASEQQGGQPAGPAPLVYYDVNFDGLSLESALDRLGKTINRQMQMDQSGGTVHVRPFSPVGYFNPYGQNQGIGGPLAVSPQAVSLSSDFPAGQPSIQVEFRVQGNSTQKAIGQAKAMLDQATDDQGKTLTLFNDMNSYPQLQPIMQSQAVVRLKCPDPSPKQIAALKGTFEWQVPSTLTRVTFTGLHDRKPIKTTFDGMDAELAAPERNGTNWTLNIKIHRGSTVSTKDWTAKKDLMTAAFEQARVTGTDGKIYQYRGGGSGGGTPDETRATLYLGRDFDNGVTNDVLPDILVWDVIHDTTSLKLPFEASNLPVP